MMEWREPNPASGHHIGIELQLERHIVTLHALGDYGVEPFYGFINSKVTCLNKSVDFLSYKRIMDI